MRTYISLFSGAGIGCYGFKEENFECIATNEIIERRLEIQKINNKCKYETGYISGDITKDDVKNQIIKEINFWKKNEKIDDVDVVIATPPCQGMSVANHKKTDNEIKRNSLVIESIKLIKEINPKFFIFENVPAFMKTICTDIDNVDKPISEAICFNLGNEYSYSYKVINFKNYGACSSRQRTIVIGVNKKYSSDISPIELFPDFTKEKTLFEVIGHLKPLKEFGEIDNNDIYHSFRTYPEHMRDWIKDLKEGESAFDNLEDIKKPHQIVNGKLVINTNKNGDKYKRQYWNKVGPCIHTRNDQLASQNTIHPIDDRVFSIRELMLMMTIPNTFKWSNKDLEFLNKLPINEKKEYLKKISINIRQSIGEAVPTIIFKNIAKNISDKLSFRYFDYSKIKKVIEKENLENLDNLLNFIKNNPFNYSFSTLSKIAELSNGKRTETAAYYTDKFLATELIKHIKDTLKTDINILEPSVGVGNFLPLIVKHFSHKKNVNIDLVDINEDSIKILKELIKYINIPYNFNLNFINDDFLLHDFSKTYDYIIGNPPFDKIQDKKLNNIYKKNIINNKTNNLCSFFLEKAIKLSNSINFVFPKFLLNTPEFEITRELLSKYSIDFIIDFGEKGFKGVLIETIGFGIIKNNKPKETYIYSYTNNLEIYQKQKYICDKKLPYWIIYRNNTFDNIYNKMIFNVFDVFRDRQLTNKLMKKNGEIRVLKSRNIIDSSSIENIDGYDSYINQNDAINLSVYKYLNNDNVYLTPNMTYLPRVMKKPKNTLVNGSLAILIPKTIFTPSQKQLDYFSSKEYRNFYKIARNYQTRSLNVDSTSVFFFGLIKEN